jgi:hypothetical protein
MGFKAVVRVVLPTIALTGEEALSLAESLLFQIMRKDAGRRTYQHKKDYLNFSQLVLCVKYK